MKNYSEMLKKVNLYDPKKKSNKVNSQDREEVTIEQLDEAIQSAIDDCVLLNGPLLDSIEDLQTRVSATVFRVSQLINLAKILKDKGVSLNSENINRGVFSNSFVADDNGYIGFNKDINAIGMYGGGVRSAFDFFIDGTGIYLCIGDERYSFDDLKYELARTNRYKALNIVINDYNRYLSKFGSRFELFEESFIAFVNNL